MQPVHKVLQQRHAVDRVLAVKRARKRRQALEPQRRVRPIALGPLTRRLTQRLEHAERKHVVLERRQVLDRIDHVLNQVVVRLDLVQHNIEKDCRVRVRGLGQAPPTRTHIVSAHAPQDTPRLALRLRAPRPQLRALVRSVLPLAVDRVALGIGQRREDAPDLVEQRGMGTAQRHRRQDLRP